jgi:D-glycero-D-manno-heptose 1,7-bisphosphate phosphatase
MTPTVNLPSFRPSVLPPSRPCVFLDRDGTIVVDPGYLRDPREVRLIPGAGAAIARLAGAGYAVVLVTNQAGISRGLVGWQEAFRVSAAMEALLAKDGARLEAVYVCPHAPELDGPCPCRKPALSHYQRAERDLGLDLRRSWFVGDRLSDLLPARALGGRGLLVLTGHGAVEEGSAASAGFEAAADVQMAVEKILAA